MKDFTKGSPTKGIIAFTLPLLAGNLFQQFYYMADTAIVGNFVGGNALAAVGVATPLVNFLLALIFGLTTGASVLVSQLYGAGQQEEMKRTLSTSLIFLLALTALMTILGVGFAPQMLTLMNAPEAARAEAAVYLRVTMAGTLFVMLYNMYASYLRALGDSKTPLVFLIISTCTNVALDLLFVASFGMGVMGAALATVIAQAVAAVCCIVYAERRVAILRIRQWIFDRKLFASLLAYSVPAAIQMSIVSLASLTIQRLINGFGATAVAGFTAATKIDAFATMPLSTISTAISTFVAQNTGAGLMQRAKKGFLSAMLLAVGLGAAISTLAFLLGETVIQWFVSAQDPNHTEIVQIGMDYLRVIAASYSLFAIFFAFNGFFRGVGDAVIVMALTITSLTLRTLSAHILVGQFAMGPEAVAYSVPIGWGLCALLGFIYYRAGWWKGKSRVSAGGSA